MIGFSFLHNSLPLALPAILSALLAQIWVIIAIAWAVYAVWQKRTIHWRSWMQLSILTVPMAILWIIPVIT